MKRVILWYQVRNINALFVVGKPMGRLALAIIVDGVTILLNENTQT